MLQLEQVKIFSGDNVTELEKLYNDWVRSKMKEMADHTILKGFKFEVLERNMVIRNYEGEETFAIAVHYLHYDLEPSQRGHRDRGGPGSSKRRVNMGGGSHGSGSAF